MIRYDRPDVFQGFAVTTSSLTTIAEQLLAATRRLASAGDPSSRLDAEVLMRHVLGLDRTGLFMRLQEQLAEDDRERFNTFIDRRIAGSPLAYLIGEREFMGLPFAVRPGSLIPRPETELLVEWALDRLPSHPSATVLDVGTGSGAIALSLAAYLPPKWHGLIVASDISLAALAVAVENLLRLNPPHPVHLVRGDLATWCGGPVDLLLANLPYLRPDQVCDNPDLAAEPSLALIGGTDGLDLVRRLLHDARRILGPGGAIGLEIDPSQTEAVTALARRALPGATVAVLPDLAGFDRHVLLEME